MEDMDNNQVRPNDTKIFKIILEYFVQHMDYLCDVKNDPVEGDELEQEHQDENKDRKKIIIKGSGLAFEGDVKINTNDSDFTKSGQGYNDDLIQTQMENYIQKQINPYDSVDNPQKFNSFTCLDRQQKICISIDASIGFIGGSYLHLLSVDSGGPAGTNINPVFTTEEKNNEITKKFVGLEVGPSKSHPEYVFPRLQFSFTELGLSEGNPNDDTQANLQMFLDYFLEMRKAELSRKDNSLTTRGYDQLLATHNMILTGAPGTGKTWAAKNIASWMICDKSYSELKESDDKNIFNSRCKLVQFHPSYDYTDFVEGLRPMKKSGGNNEIGFELTNGVFKKFCEEALKNQDKEDPKIPRYVFIIDEINRGELSKIFGELFYSIDPGYRGTNGAVLTQYANMVEEASVFDQKLGFLTKNTNTPPPGTPDNTITPDADIHENFQPKTDEDPTHSNQIIRAASEGANKPEFGNFFVPENVYIIGTMNDIDRSVDSMDFAMRRRFSFIEVKANERMDIWTGKDWGDLAAACMIAINNEIDMIPGLNSAYHVGPAYFKKLDDYNKNHPDFFKLWDNHLHGVLFEYLRGKKDAEGTINTIQNSYLKALVKAINSRFNVSGKWGERLIKKGNSASTLNANIKNTDSAKDYLKKIKGEIKFDDNLLSDSINREEEINKMRIMIKRHMDIGKNIMELPD